MQDVNLYGYIKYKVRMNQNSRPIKGREAFPVVPPLLIALATRFVRRHSAIGPHDNAWAAFRATSDEHIHPDSSRGNFTGFLPGGVSVYAPCLPVGFAPATFLFQSLYILMFLLSANVLFCQAFRKNDLRTSGF